MWVTVSEIQTKQAKIRRPGLETAPGKQEMTRTKEFEGVVDKESRQR